MSPLLWVTLALMRLTWPTELRERADNALVNLLAAWQPPAELQYQLKVQAAAHRLRCVVSLPHVETVTRALRDAAERLDDQLAALEDVYRRYVAGDVTLHRSEP